VSVLDSHWVITPPRLDVQEERPESWSSDGWANAPGPSGLAMEFLIPDSDSSLEDEDIMDPVLGLPEDMCTDMEVEDQLVLKQVLNVLDVFDVSEVIKSFKSTLVGEVIKRAQTATVDSVASEKLLTMSNNNHVIFKKHGLESVVTKSRECAGVNLLSPKSVDEYMLPEESEEELADKTHITTIAKQGLNPIVNSTFVATSVSQEFPNERFLSKKVKGAILELSLALAQAGQAIVIPTDDLLSLPVYNVIPTHWTDKPSNELGRLLADCSAGTTNINGKGLVEVTRATYGLQKLPQFMEIALMLCESTSRLKDPVMSLDDVHGAFNNVPLALSFIPKAALNLTLGDIRETKVSLLYTSMFFGATTSPFIFDIFSRSILRRIRTFSPYSLIYVDDSIRIHEREDTERDGGLTIDAFCDLLSPGSQRAWASEKAQWGVKQASYLGWHWDIENMTVSLPVKAIVKLVTYLIRLTESQVHSVREIQRVSSLMTRYSVLWPHLAGLSHVVYRIISGSAWRNQDISIDITKDVREVGMAWLHVFTSEVRNQGGWSAPLNWFSPLRKEVSLQFDAALKGAGAVSPAPFFDKSEALEEVKVYQQVMWSDTESDDFWYFQRDLVSDEQNSTELIAAMFGLTALVVCDVRDSNIILVGDSKSALAWLTGGLKSSKALAAFAVVGSLCRKANLRILKSEKVWVASEDNPLTDKMSRNRLEDCADQLEGFVANPIPKTWIAEVLKFVDPTVDHLVKWETFTAMFQEAERLVEELYSQIEQC
jgi:hypothetical protein